MNQKPSNISLPDTISFCPCQDCRIAEMATSKKLMPTDIEHIDIYLKRKLHLRQNDRLFREGDPCRNIYLIESGCLRGHVTQIDGSEQTVNYAFPGELVGLEALNNGNYGVTMLSVQKTEVCEISLFLFSYLAAKTPGVLSYLINHIRKNPMEQHEQGPYISLATAKEKTALFLYLLSKRLDSNIIPESIFHLPMDNSHIAEFLALPQATVNSEIAALVQKDILAFKDQHLHINQRDALKTIAGKSCPQE